jgi:Ras family
MSDFERIRLVLLGGAGVGKSCVVRRFLTKTYCDKYRPTVEDLHNREYDLGSVTLKVINGRLRSASDWKSWEFSQLKVCPPPRRPRSTSSTRLVTCSSRRCDGSRSPRPTPSCWSTPSPPPPAWSRSSSASRRSASSALTTR